MLISKLRVYFLGSGIRASQPIVWLIGFFAFLNGYSIELVLPLDVQDFRASGAWELTR